MFNKMRNYKRQLSSEDISRILTEGEYGILGTIGENNYPYTTPINYVYTDGYIYFHCATCGTKLENIKSNNRVSFCVVGKTKILPDKFSTIYESVIAFGKSAIVFDENKKKSVLIDIVDKYSPEFKKEGLEYINHAIDKVTIVKITIEHVTAKGRLK